MTDLHFVTLISCGLLKTAAGSCLYSVMEYFVLLTFVLARARARFHSFYKFLTSMDEQKKLMHLQLGAKGLNLAFCFITRSCFYSNLELNC
jgi:hypothetical protein